MCFSLGRAASVAQLDRVLVSETKGRRFESSRARAIDGKDKGRKVKREIKIEFKLILAEINF
ncbi:MAG: hypothetical protein K0R24_1972 [Gammaproteobacteria bacterium]|nr:hypothetical protein [Gammaproteobacteria bacterium]